MNYQSDNDYDMETKIRTDHFKNDGRIENRRLNIQMRSPCGRISMLTGQQREWRCIGHEDKKENGKACRMLSGDIYFPVVVRLCCGIILYRLNEAKRYFREADDAKYAG